MTDHNQDSRIKVLVVEDSLVLQKLLMKILNSDPGLEVVAVVSNGVDALSAVEKYHPQVVTMDYHMPKMNGLIATRSIMETHPVPIVIVSSTLAGQSDLMTFQIMEAGALAVVGKPIDPGHPDYGKLEKELIQTVKTMAEIKVVRRWPQQNAIPALCRNKINKQGLKLPKSVNLIALGASTGGPAVIKTILSALPQNFLTPILIVQHIAQGFSQGLADWLTSTTGKSVKLAENRELVKPGYIYLAPEGRHLKINKEGFIELVSGPPVSGHQPSVTALFESVAMSFGAQALGVLLTGMGNDGASGLKLMKDQGAFTIVQDKDSSIVYGMPAEALKLDAASMVLNPVDIGLFLCQFRDDKLDKELKE